MSVEFHEGPVMPTHVRTQAYSFPTRLVMKMGLAKTPEAAGVVLFIVAVACGLLSLFLFTSVGGSPPPADPELLRT